MLVDRDTMQPIYYLDQKDSQEMWREENRPALLVGI